MLKITDVLPDLIESNLFLEYGLVNRLYNLSQLAEFLKPALEIRLQKEVSSSALLMALSRYQRKLPAPIKAPNPALVDYATPGHPRKSINSSFKLQRISVQNDLCTCTYHHTPENREKMHLVDQWVQKNRGNFSLTETAHELTCFFAKKFLDEVLRQLPENPKYQNQDIVSVNVQFEPELFEVPGLLYALMQAINRQNINLIEIASTYTGFSFYVNRQDAKLVFETLQRFF